MFPISLTIQGWLWGGSTAWPPTIREEISSGLIGMGDLPQSSTLIASAARTIYHNKNVVIQYYWMRFAPQRYTLTNKGYTAEM